MLEDSNISYLKVKIIPDTEKTCISVPASFTPEKVINEPAKPEAHKNLRIARYPGDLGPEHFVRREDYDMLKAYLIQQRVTAKRINKRTSRWHNKVIEVKTLSDLKKNGLLSSETAGRIRVSLPNITGQVKCSYRNT